MKKGDSLQLSSVWWAKNKPAVMPETGLGAALQDYEKYKMTAMSGGKEAEGLKAVKALTALDKVETARLKGISHCVGPLFYDTKAALQRTAALTTANNLYVNGLLPHVKLFESAVDTMPSYLTRLNNQVKAYNAAKTDKDKEKAVKEIKLARERLEEYVEVCKDAVAMLGSAQVVLHKHATVWTPFSQARTKWTALAPQTRQAIADTRHYLD